MIFYKHEFIIELMVFAKCADFRTEKTKFSWLLFGSFCLKENKFLFMNLFEVY